MTRLFDIFFSSLAILLLTPLFFPIMLILRITGEGKVFYHQERVGKDGQLFGLWKFATMLENSPNMKNAYITTHDDPRVLPMGRFLRKSKINELPQLINILKGDISIVGPRPQVQAHLELYPKNSVDDIVSIQPGLTGIASLFFRDEETMISNSTMQPKEFYKTFIAPYKVELELWYKKRQNLSLYFTLIILTANNVIFPKSTLYKRIFKDLPEPPRELEI